MSVNAIPLGAGFAFARHMALDPWWVILVSGGYGPFLFEGTEGDAEQARQDTARSEGAIAHKRIASCSDFETPSACWNHRGFVRLQVYGSRGRVLRKPRPVRFVCGCGACSDV